MVRVHNGVARHKRVKRILKRAKGYRGQRSKNLRSAIPRQRRAPSTSEFNSCAT